MANCRIRQGDKNRLLPIILVTALRETEDRVKVIEAGCDDFTSKPVAKTELLARVRSLLKIKDYNNLRSNYQKELESEVNKRTEELKQASDKLKAASLDTIYRLSVASEYKDQDTGAHIKRMSRYCAAIARRMGLDENTVASILYAAPMHDLGKIGIPDKILAKPGKLDPGERDIMKLHTVIGAKILSRSDEEFIKLGGTIALSHHEKWDGSGYPNGLKGTAIPVSGRIAAIADVFDALTSKRPYKEPFSLEKSMVIIRRWSESYFDPHVVDAFMAIQDEILTIKEECAENNHQAFDIPELTTLLQRYESDESHNEPLKIRRSMGTDLSTTLSLPLNT
jgi:putative two-component system response regulator